MQIKLGDGYHTFLNSNVVSSQLRLDSIHFKTLYSETCEAFAT